MKTLYLVLCLSLTALTTAGQGNEKGAVVAATYMNVLYRGVSNPIAIAVPGIASENVAATVTNGTIKKVNEGWEIIPGDQDLSQVSVMVNGKKVSEKEFRVRNIPVPEASFAGKNNGVASKELVSETETLEVKLGDFVWNLRFTITGFRMRYTRDNADYEFVSDSNMLTNEMKSAISGLKKGETLIFKDIKSIGPDGRAKDLSPIILKID